MEKFLKTYVSQILVKTEENVPRELAPDVSQDALESIAKNVVCIVKLKPAQHSCKLSLNLKEKYSSFYIDKTFIKTHANQAHVKTEGLVLMVIVLANRVSREQNVKYVVSKSKQGSINSFCQSQVSK